MQYFVNVHVIQSTMILKVSIVFMGCYGIVPIPDQCLPTSLREWKGPLRAFLIFFTITNLICYCYTLGHFLLVEAKTPALLFLSAFFVSSSTIRITMYCLILMRNSELMKLIDELESVIETRK